MLGCKWDQKLERWVVYMKQTGKVIGKTYETKEDAMKALSKLRDDGEEDRLNRRLRP